MALQNADETRRGLIEALAAKIRAEDWDSIDAEELKGLLWSLWVDSRANFDLPEYVFLLYRCDKDGKRTAVPGPWQSGSGPAARVLLEELFKALKGNARRRLSSRDKQKWEQLGKLEGRVKLEMTLRYLDAQKEASASAFDVLVERLRPPAGQPFTKISELGERLSEDDEKNPAVQARAIRDWAMQEMSVALATLAEVKRRGFTATPRGIKAALGLSRKTRPRFRAPAQARTAGKRKRKKSVS